MNTDTGNLTKLTIDELRYAKSRVRTLLYSMPLSNGDALDRLRAQYDALDAELATRKLNLL